MNQTLGVVLVLPQACLFSSALSPSVSTASYQSPSSPYYYGEFPRSSGGKAQAQGPVPPACLGIHPAGARG